MIKTILFLTVFTILTSSTAFAESSATVEIHNNLNTNSTNSNSTTKSHTDITVETNGKVTHYESDEPGSVSVKSVNGESEIKVNGVSVSSPPKEPTSSPTTETSQSPTPTINKEIEEVKEKANQIEEMINDLKEKIDDLKSSISSLFD